MKKRESHNRITGKKRRIWSLILVGILLLIIFLQNKVLVTTGYTVETDKIKEKTGGMRIVQISDLHNAQFGIKNSALVKTVKKLPPDLIVITGDIVDSSFTNIQVAVRFVEDMSRICPVYYITGNHEWWLSEEKRNELFQKLETAGAVILSNEAIALSDDMTLIGLDDRNLKDDTLKTILESGNVQEDFTIVLAHEPQNLSRYAAFGADLVLAGHAHGGQVRIPFVGGVIAPDQGFWPKYTAGVYMEKNTEMIVSRGLGNSVIPIRILNQPEIVYIDLTGKEN